MYDYHFPDSVFGRGNKTIVNGYDIGYNALPSDQFYTGTNGMRVETVFGGMDCEPTITDLEDDQKELYQLYRTGKMDSASYQREWQQLEDQINAIRKERGMSKRYAESQADDDMSV